MSQNINQLEAMALCFALESYFPAMTKVVDAARRRHAGDMGPKKTILHPGKDEFDGLVDDYDGKVKYFGVPGRLRDFGDALMSNVSALTCTMLYYTPICENTIFYGFLTEM